ncbi:uncharacterized protein E0L32_012394 [Thyridium curvatum]|uniref:Cyclase n=1 Tax=Thyridium curvatum TaxID=1093900 RepID=A0A507B115_9PEZI|nr:uncharacterized protein E0L32_012394 [Thyridium curvatum]TPX16775.1 hypothetical protein E0L32_012394 [Thyridium curvatum]
MAGYKLPDFDNLPAIQGMPQGCAWGVFDTDGKKDVFGTINLITPDIVTAAASEIQEGISVSLNWPIGAIETPSFLRKGLEHKVIDFRDSAMPLHGFDDEPTGTAYNGTKGSIEAFQQNFGDEDKDQKHPTLDHWHSRGCLVARGVLIDYKAWADHKGVQYDLFDAHRIQISEIEQVAADQGVKFRQGDVLIIRTGFTEALSTMTGQQQSEALSTYRSIGVDGSKESAKWFWNKHFAAVAGDMIAFEAMPPLNDDGSEGAVSGLVLHQYFLAMFGMPIGELWDLEALSKTCSRLGRYSFMLTSSPLNVPGSIGSPPNAIAIF